MDFNQFTSTFDDPLAAFGGHSGSNKRERVDLELNEDCAFESAAKKISIVIGAGDDEDVFAPNPVHFSNTVTLPDTMVPQGEMMKPYPFFNYNDFSTESDPDPLTPLTPPGRVPNFPAKMQAILSRTDLKDIISWMPHGRAWRVHKPREFEVRVIPTYFEHAKFSSFIRQANGWGFRRITHGRDKNCYYHPLFLRGLPHLCKKMKRPGVSEKITIDPDHEPDLYKISDEFPVPEKTDDESVMLHCTLQGGPKARMPIYSASTMMSTSHSRTDKSSTSGGTISANLTPSDQQALVAFQQSLGASESQVAKRDYATPSLVNMPPTKITKPLQTVVSQPNPVPYSLPFNAAGTKSSPLALANQLAFSSPNMNQAMQSGSAASQFAAGFAAATALSQQQFQQMLAALQQQGVTIPGMPQAQQARAAPVAQPAPVSMPYPTQQQQTYTPAQQQQQSYTDSLFDSFAEDDFGLADPSDFWQ